jgi:hypothetical protein
MKAKELDPNLFPRLEVVKACERFAIYYNKPFWISDSREHKKADIANKENCCFNHIIGYRAKMELKNRPLIISRH